MTKNSTPVASLVAANWLVDLMILVALKVGQKHSVLFTTPKRAATQVDSRRSVVRFRQYGQKPSALLRTGEPASLHVVQRILRCCTQSAGVKQSVLQVVLYQDTTKYR